MGRCGWLHTYLSFYKRHLSIHGSGHPLVLLRPVSAMCLPGDHFCILVENYSNWQLQILLGSKDAALWSIRVRFSMLHRTTFALELRFPCLLLHHLQGFGTLPKLSQGSTASHL